MQKLTHIPAQNTATAMNDSISIGPDSTQLMANSMHEGVEYVSNTAAAYCKTPLTTCPQCGGSGELYTRRCTHCKGRGLVTGRTR